MYIYIYIYTYYIYIYIHVIYIYIHVIYIYIHIIYIYTYYIYIHIIYIYIYIYILYIHGNNIWYHCMLLYTLLNPFYLRTSTYHQRSIHLSPYLRITMAFWSQTWLLINTIWTQSSRRGFRSIEQSIKTTILDRKPSLTESSESVQKCRNPQNKG